MYGKVFSSLFTGSMRGKGDLQLVFAYMISNATADGTCDFTPQCIADATGKPLELINDCIKELENEDHMSRTRKDDGRRIRLIDDSRPWGWEIINHKMYRDIGNGATMKEAERLRKREYRERKKKEELEDVPKMSGTIPESTVVVSASVHSSREGECEGEQLKPKTVKQPYGEFKNVMLTDKEHTKLVDIHGYRSTEAAIDALGAWLERTGKTRKNHYACMDKASFVWEKVGGNRKQDKHYVTRDGTE